MILRTGVLAFLGALLAGGGQAGAAVPPVEARSDSALTTPLRLVFYPGPGPRPTPWETPSGDAEPDSRFFTVARHNRVQGFLLTAGFRRPLERSAFRPAYQVDWGYGFAAKRSVFGIAFEQPLLPRNRVTFGAEAFRRAIPFYYGDERISLSENSLSSLFVRRDYLDWFEGEGIRGFLGFHPGPDLSARFGVVTQQERTLVTEAGFAFFRRKSDFRENPAIPVGTLRSYEAEVTLDTRPRTPDGDPQIERETWSGVEHMVRLRWERSDPGLDSDFDHWRFDADLRTYLRLTADQLVSTRIWVGTGGSATGLLPPHRQFMVGGLGTLRGQNYADRSGNHVVLANLEYGFAVGDGQQLLVFTDAGNAWASGPLGRQRILVDAGAGFRLGDPGISLLAARSLNRADPDVKLYLRFQRSF